MMKRRLLFSLLCSTVLFLSACSLDSNDKHTNYEQTKEMVKDVLQTEDGKKVLKEIFQEDSMKEALIIETDEVNETIQHALMSQDNKEMWQQLFSDPEFVKSFQAAITEEQISLFKKLMHDATFQAQLLDLLHNPEMEKQMVTALKSQEMRAHLETVIEQSFKTPAIEENTSKLIQQVMEKKRSKDGQEEGSQNQGSKENKGGQEQ